MEAGGDVSGVLDLPFKMLSQMKLGHSAVTGSPLGCGGWVRVLVTALALTALAMIVAAARQSDLSKDDGR